MAITSKPQFYQGKQVEAFLDEFFRDRGWKIVPTTEHEERVLCLGDRHFEKDGKGYWIEYKSGLQTKYTNNIFLETVSVDTSSVQGWVYTCQADFIFYAALLNDVILVFEPSFLRSQIESLKERFPEKKTAHQQNDGYNTHGIVVPLDYAELKLAAKIIRLDGSSAL